MPQTHLALFGLVAWVDLHSSTKTHHIKALYIFRLLWNYSVLEGAFYNTTAARGADIAGGPPYIYIHKYIRAGLLFFCLAHACVAAARASLAVGPDWP